MVEDVVVDEMEGTLVVGVGVVVVLDNEVVEAEDIAIVEVVEGMESEGQEEAIEVVVEGEEGRVILVNGVVVEEEVVVELINPAGLKSNRLKSYVIKSTKLDCCP